MNTKEAIEILKEFFEGNEESLVGLSEIIALLKCGEAYEKMWGEFKLINREYFSNFEIRANYIIRMEELEQKYFPKNYIEGFEGKLKEEKEKHYCLFCEAELDFVPTEDGGFCSTECEDSWNES